MVAWATTEVCRSIDELSLCKILRCIYKRAARTACLPPHGCMGHHRKCAHPWKRSPDVRNNCASRRIQNWYKPPKLARTDLRSNMVDRSSTTTAVHPKKK